MTKNKLEPKKKLLKEFLELTIEQSQLIEAKEYEHLFNIFNEKQTIIEQVNLFDADFDADLNKEETELEEVTKEIQNILSEAIELDNKNKIIMQQNKEEIAAKIKSTGTRRKTHSLYRGKHASIEGVLLDKKSK